MQNNANIAVLKMAQNIIDKTKSTIAYTGKELGALARIFPKKLYKQRPCHYNRAYNLYLNY
jgi:hypothetical protein